MLKDSTLTSEIDVSDSGAMLWITEPDGRLAISGGEINGAVNVLVDTASGEASVDLSPQSATAAARCLLTYAGNDVVCVNRQTLDELLAAVSAAEAVLEVVNLGKPLRLALQRLKAQVATHS